MSAKASGKVQVGKDQGKAVRKGWPSKNNWKGSCDESGHCDVDMTRKGT